jgi:hypothetical protein
MSTAVGISLLSSLEAEMYCISRLAATILNFSDFRLHRATSALAPLSSWIPKMVVGVEFSSNCKFYCVLSWAYLHAHGCPKCFGSVTCRIVTAFLYWVNREFTYQSLYYTMMITINRYPNLYFSYVIKYATQSKPPCFKLSVILFKNAITKVRRIRKSLIPIQSKKPVSAHLISIKIVKY